MSPFTSIHHHTPLYITIHPCITPCTSIHTSYETLSRGILWNILRVTCIFSVNTRTFVLITCTKWHCPYWNCFLKRFNEIYEYIGFMLSLFLKILFVSIVSLVFTLGPFFLLSTFKNIAITQNVYHSLKPRTTWPKKGYLNLSKSIIKVFLPSSGMCKTTGT